MTKKRRKRQLPRKGFDHFCLTNSYKWKTKFPNTGKKPIMIDNKDKITLTTFVPSEAEQ